MSPPRRLRLRWPASLKAPRRCCSSRSPRVDRSTGSNQTSDRVASVHPGRIGPHAMRSTPNAPLDSKRSSPNRRAGPSARRDPNGRNGLNRPPGRNDQPGPCAKSSPNRLDDRSDHLGRCAKSGPNRLDGLNPRSRPNRGRGHRIVENAERWSVPGEKVRHLELRVSLSSFVPMKSRLVPSRPAANRQRRGQQSVACAMRNRLATAGENAPRRANSARTSAVASGSATTR